MRRRHKYRVWSRPYTSDAARPTVNPKRSNCPQDRPPEDRWRATPPQVIVSVLSEPSHWDWPASYTLMSSPATLTLMATVAASE